MRIAITGSTGRVGGAIVDMALADGHSLVCIDRVAPAAGTKQPNTTFVLSEMSDYDTLLSAMRGCDSLIHMAAIAAPGHHPDQVVHNNNVVGSYNALRAAAELGMQRVCQASSINAIARPIAATRVTTISPWTSFTPPITRIPIACRSGSASSRPSPLCGATK